MADPTPGIRLTPSTQAALQRIATAPATSEQGLSGAAQAVLDAFESTQFADQYAIAAALRAAADQVVPGDDIEPMRAIVEREYPDPVFIGAWHIWNAKRRARSELLNIAAELEGLNE